MSLRFKDIKMNEKILSYTIFGISEIKFFPRLSIYRIRKQYINVCNETKHGFVKTSPSIVFFKIIKGYDQGRPQSVFGDTVISNGHFFFLTSGKKISSA